MMTPLPAPPRLLHSILLASALFTSSAFATDLVNDTWRDSNRTQPASPVYSENGTDADADLNLESAWFTSSAGAMTIVDDVVPGGDQLLRTTNSTGSASWTTYLTPTASPVTLLNNGDQLKVTWIFTPTNVGTNDTGQGLRLAICDWQETNIARLTTDTAPSSGVYFGYGMFMNMCTNLNSSTPFRLLQRTNLASSAFLSASAVYEPLTNAGAVDPNGYKDGTQYTFVFTATLTNTTELLIQSSMTGTGLYTNGSLSLSYVDTTPQTLKFDTFSLRPSTAASTAGRFETALFKAEFNTGGCTPGTNYNVTGGGAICAGDPGVSVTLSGSDTGVDYQLKRAGTDVGSPVPGTGAALSFGLQNVAGTYTVIASNTVSLCTGLMSGSAVVSINASPSISVHPVSGSAPAGSSKNFSVTAAGAGLSYQWRRAETNLINGGGISGATTATLNINPVSLTDATNYDVIVSGTCTPPATSSVAVLTVTLPANLTWVGDGTANLWNTTTPNWTGDSTLFTSGDNVTINDSGNNTLALDLVGSIDPTSILVSNVTKDFIIGTTTTGVLGGTATVTKNGSGKLTLSTINTFTGKATVNGGTLSITTGSNLGTAPGAFTADQLTLNGGALQVTASGSVNANRGTTLGVNGGTFDIPASINFTNGPAVTGSGGLAKTGAGSLVFAGANSYLGATVISNGTLSIGNVLSLGTGSITLAGGTLNTTASLADLTNDINMTASSTISGGNVSPRFNGALTASAGTLTFNGSAATFTPRLQSPFTFGQPIVLATANTSLRFYNLTGVQTVNGVVSGPGNIHRRSANAGVAGETLFTAANTYSAGTTIADGIIGFGIDSTGAAGALTDGPIGTSSLIIIEANVNLLATCAVYAAGGARSVGNAMILTNTEPLIIGGANDLTLYGNVTLSGAGITTLQTDNTGKTIMSGVLAGGSVTKSGAGLLLLNGINTYTGITTVSNGTLGGNGTIAGPVVVESGGNLAPGASIGVLTVNSNLTLNGTFTAELNSSAATNCDRVIGLNDVLYGGALAVTNIGPALTASDTFQLFSATTYAGAFASITPATPGAGLTWNTNTLTADGTLRIAAIGGGPATNPTNIVSSVGGGNLTLSWPAGHLGWTLQTQTNTRSVGLVPATNAWFNVAGSASVTNIVIPVGTANPTVFYRLMLFVP